MLTVEIPLSLAVLVAALFLVVVLFSCFLYRSNITLRNEVALLNQENRYMEKQAKKFIKQCESLTEKMSALRSEKEKLLERGKKETNR